MQNRTSTIVVVAAALLVGARVLGQNAELSVRIESDKLLYEPGDTAAITVTLVNAGEEDFTGPLRVTGIWEMEDTRALLEQAVQVAAGQTNVVRAEWPGLAEVLGCEVKAELLGSDGRTAAEGSEYFNVCRHLDMLRVGIHGVAIGLQSYSTPEFLTGIRDEIMPSRKRHYINIGEYFVGKSHVWNLAPEEDEYPGGGYWESTTAVRTGIEEGHRFGMRSVAYVTSYSTHGLDDLEVSLRHPEWLAFDRFGQPLAGVNVEREDRLRNPTHGMHPQPGPFVSAVIHWMDPKALSYHIDQLIANHKLVGMDGVRYDGEPGSQWGDTDIFGVPAPTGEARAAERIRIIRHIRKRMREAVPSYLFMFNAGCAVGAGNPVDLRNGVLAPDLVPIVEDGGALCNEEIRGAYSAINHFHAWRQYADAMVSDADLTRPAGGYAYCLFPWPSTVHRNTDEIGYSIMLAAGSHVWWGNPADDVNNPGGSHYPIQRELYAFATRFSAMLWGHGIDRVRDAEDVVDVRSEKGEIWWTNFVHRRTLPDGRVYLIVHLLNAPPNESMGVIDQPLPDPMANVQVAFKVPVRKVWTATARPGPPRLVTLSREERSGTNWRRAPQHEAYGPPRYGPVPLSDGKLIVPELRVWTMVVAELEEQ